jgi:GxxExxY protein
VEGALVVEIKAVAELHPVHVAQVMSYLKASGCRLGLLLNFAVKSMKQGVRRVVLS